jgi:SAM-dependent methyltransferase
MRMDDHQETNLAHWNALVSIHAASAFYDVAGFKAGKLSLRPLEIEELGDVSGKSLLHLQCHFGLDTLSWARLGASVTGVDFSGEAIALAEALGRELDIPARFICSNIYDLPRHLDEEFDIIFTCYGVLAWLGDLQARARLLKGYLQPDGTFYIVEQHPFLEMLDYDPAMSRMEVRNSYFPSDGPGRYETVGSYAEPDAPVCLPTYQWVHSLAEVVSALTAAGLRLPFLHEFPYVSYCALPNMEQGADGWWRLPDSAFPLTFSLKATK